MMKKTKNPKQSGVAKVPVILQLEYRECGAACLAMVASYYGKWISLEEARRDTGVSRNGTSAGNIARAARSYGFIVKGYSLKAEHLEGKAKATLLNLLNVHSELDGLVSYENFRRGFILGAQLMLTVLSSEEEGEE